MIEFAEWYQMHSHDNGTRHAHHKDNTGHGSHDGVPLVTQQEAMVDRIVYPDEVGRPATPERPDWDRDGAYNETNERPEDTVRRYAKRILELEAEQAQHAEAIAMWDALEVNENDQVTEALLIAKLASFDSEGGTVIMMSTTDGCDWVVQLGLIHGALQVMNSNPPEKL